MPEKPLTLVLGAWGNIVLGKGILSIWFFILRSLSLNFAVAKHQLFNQHSIQTREGKQNFIHSQIHSPFKCYFSYSRKYNFPAQIVKNIIQRITHHQRKNSVSSSLSHFAQLISNGKKNYMRMQKSCISRRKTNISVARNTIFSLLF